MRLVGISHLAARHPLDLSGGQLQRLALAGLLAMEPKLLLLDAPTSQLAPAGTAAICEVLAGLHERGVTIVMVEHRLETLCELCPRIVAMVAGRVLADGPPEDVFNRQVVQERVGLPVFTRLARDAGLPAPWPVRLSDSTAALHQPFARAGWKARKTFIRTTWVSASGSGSPSRRRSPSNRRCWSWTSRLSARTIRRGNVCGGW